MKADMIPGGRWCQKCWLSKQTVFYDEYGQYLCRGCFEYIVTRDLKKVIGESDD